MVSRNICVECHRRNRSETERRARKANPEKFKARRRASYEKNSEVEIAKAMDRHRRTNPEIRRARAQKWRDENRATYRSLHMKRQAAKLQATPPWADQEKIAAVYVAAEQLTSDTGVLHHVDHVVPLQGKNVCGLHVQNNLSPIPWLENQQKGNRLCPTVSGWG